MEINGIYSYIGIINRYLPGDYIDIDESPSDVPMIRRCSMLQLDAML
jgi:hypothetical protein